MNITKILTGLLFALKKITDPNSDGVIDVDLHQPEDIAGDVLRKVPRDILSEMQSANSAEREQIMNGFANEYGKLLSEHTPKTEKEVIDRLNSIVAQVRRLSTEKRENYFTEQMLNLGDSNADIEQRELIGIVQDIFGQMETDNYKETMEQEATTKAQEQAKRTSYNDYKEQFTGFYKHAYKKVLEKELANAAKKYLEEQNARLRQDEDIFLRVVTTSFEKECQDPGLKNENPNTRNKEESKRPQSPKGEAFAPQFKAESGVLEKAEHRTETDTKPKKPPKTPGSRTHLQ